MLNKYYTSIKSQDGYGAQYQRVIQSYIFCKMHNLNFVYSPIDFVEHNYTNDTDYNKQIKDLENEISEYKKALGKRDNDIKILDLSNNNIK